MTWEIGVKKIIGMLLLAGISSAVQAHTCGKMPLIIDGYWGEQVATAISDAGVIVGYVGVPDNGFATGFVWDSGVVMELPGLGGGFTIATSINDRGQVVGYSDSGPIRLKQVAWLAPPRERL